MRSEDLYFRKVEGNIKDNMHGCVRMKTMIVNVN